MDGTEHNSIFSRGVAIMRVGLGLTQEQTQKLIMTPELRLAIKILQMSTVELVECVDEQLVENPVLEVDDSSDAEPESPADKAVESNAEKSDIDWDQYFEDEGGTRKEVLVDRGQEDMRYDNFIAEIPTLQDHLMFQLALARLSVEEKQVGEFYIGNIDDNGYLRCSVEEAAQQCRVPASVSEKVLNTLQGFDPAGVGARDLQECLLIQYEQMDLPNVLLRKVITDYLQELAEGKIMKVAKKLGISLQEMQGILDNLRLLEPKPGRRFSRSHDTRYILPDVVIEKVNNEYIVLVNDTAAPRLTINSSYRDILRGSDSDAEGRKFIEAKLNSAAWLIRSIEQRRVTLYKVARAIVDFQLGFFDQGVKFLKPMILRQVADRLNVHESTVSRATANKYMQTPRGVFEMKFFFPGGISNRQGRSTSVEAIKQMISELIDNEDSKKPLSDQKIAGILSSRGIEVSRRTIAKYRDEMGILSTSRRRRF